ncbi:MAG: hypothetical protein CUN55_14095 [Phototrophicales bacterium]|nr:MAG: hypothetical protein CUN55_14095 [Phototrophicales bacterium]
MLDPQIQYVTVDGITLAYRACGIPQRGTMVLLHGLSECSAFFWRPLIRHFEQHYRIIAFDLLGHGDSDKPESGYEIEQQSALLRAAIHQLGETRIILIGHSLGGIIATRMALDEPSLIEKLVLYDAPLSDKPHRNFLMFLQRVPDTALFLLLSALTPKPISKIFVGLIPLRWATRAVLWRWRVPYNRQQLNEEFMQHSVRHSSYALMESARNAYMRHNVMQELRQLQPVTCLIVGEDDVLLPEWMARRIKHHIPNCELYMIKKAGHVSLIDQPVQFNAALEQFLSKNI